MEDWMHDVPKAVVEAQRGLRARIPDLAERDAKVTAALRAEVAAVKAEQHQTGLRDGS